MGLFIHFFSLLVLRKVHDIDRYMHETPSERSEGNAEVLCLCVNKTDASSPSS